MFFMKHLLRECSLTGVSELSGEATNIFIWCLTQNVDCYKQWVSDYSSFSTCSIILTPLLIQCGLFQLILLNIQFIFLQDKIYQDNLEASVSVLKKLSDDWKTHSLKLAPFDALRETLKSFRIKVVPLFLRKT